MLERLDTIIAFATILLGVSLLITILNQMVAALLGHRATYLKRGIKDLLTTLDPKLKDQVDEIVNKVLTNDLASDSIFAHVSWAPDRWRMATAIRPEELSKVLLLVSRGEVYEKNVQAIVDAINPALQRQAKMVNQLAPNATVTADQLVRDLSNSAANAIGRLEAAFSSTMDRVRQRFTLQMRIWTIVFAVIFAFVYHMDVRRIYSQLSTDPALRASVSSISSDLIKTYTEVAPKAPNATGAGANAPAPDASGAPAPGGTTPNQQTLNLEEETAKLSKAYTDVRDKLSALDMDLLSVPQPWYIWKADELLGILAMTALLSLGAPFWYNVLSNLVNLRSKVAQKQKEEEASSS